MAKDNEPTVREVVGAYAVPQPMEEAARRLRKQGIADDRVALLTSETSVRDHLDHLFAASEDDPDSAFQALQETDDAGHGLSRGMAFTGQTAAAGALVVTAASLGGPLIAGLAGVAAVGGAGAAAMAFINQDDVDKLQEHLDQGHLLLCVQVNGDDVEQIKSALKPDSIGVRVCELRPSDG